MDVDLKDSTGEELVATAARSASSAETLTPRDIAARLRLAERTVKVHVGNVLAKLGVSTRTQAALLATRR